MKRSKPNAHPGSGNGLMPETQTIKAFLDERHIELAALVEGFAEREIAVLPEPKDDNSARAQALKIMRNLGSAGWFAPITEQDLRACCLVREALAAASPLADAVFALQALGSTPIIIAGSTELRERWLPAMADGDAMAAFAMTEPESGSDVGSMQTTASRNGTEYILNGLKTLISNAGIADFYTLFAVTDPARGSRGISCFAIPADLDGLNFVRAQVLSSPHPLGEIQLADCHVPASCMVGAEGEGFKLGMATLDRLRATVGAAACGIAQRALREAFTHSVKRTQFGKPLSDFQLTQQKLARMATDLAAARLLVYRAAWEKDRGADRVTVESAMAKSFATEAAQRIVDDAIQIIGGRGLLADHPVDRLYRSIRSLRIYEGTTEIQQLIIAGKMIKTEKESTT